MIQECVMIGFLTLFSIEDVKERQLRISVLLLFGIVGLLLHLLLFQNTILEIAGGMLVGGVVMLLAKLTKESIGMGDAILLAATGIYLGGRQNMQLLFYAIFLAGIWALILFVTKRKSKKQEIPFVPFLFLSYFILMLIQ